MNAIRIAAVSLLTLQIAEAAEVARKDHVGLPVPEYATGEECLFCHRNDVGPEWPKNSHAWTTRPVGEPPAVGALPSDATHVIGGVNAYMGLKQIGYGQFALYSTRNQTWQSGVFEQRCAGCHTTAVDPQTLRFATSGLDCVVCHGVVPAEHTTNGALAWFGKNHRGAPRLEVAICAQCHLRGGKSASSGRPYPNNFFAGDDLFIDYQVDLRKDVGLDRNDAHGYLKTRAVLEGKSDRTCADCHKVHVAASAVKARQRDPRLHSAICGY